jgi:hypothetical protein
MTKFYISDLDLVCILSMGWHNNNDAMLCAVIVHFPQHRRCAAVSDSKCSGTSVCINWHSATTSTQLAAALASRLHVRL